MSCILCSRFSLKWRKCIRQYWDGSMMDCSLTLCTLQNLYVIVIVSNQQSNHLIWWTCFGTTVKFNWLGSKWTNYYKKKEILINLLPILYKETIFHITIWNTKSNGFSTLFLYGCNLTVVFKGESCLKSSNFWKSNKLKHK